MSRPAIDVGRLLDEGRWTAYQRWAVFLAALAIVFDGVDNQLLGIAIPAVMRDWSVPRSAFAPVVFFGYIGMMAGGVLAGLAGDRFGRKVALAGSMLIFGATTLAVAAVNSPGTLGVLRFAAGIGLGGAMPNAAALAAEFVPSVRRPIAVTLTIVCVPLGGTVAGLLGIRALALLGWRMLFVLGGLVPIVAAALYLRLLPESPRYLVRRPARHAELAHVLNRMGHLVPSGATFADATEHALERAPLSRIFQTDLRADTLALWGAFFSGLLAVYIVFSWLTSLLTGAGFDAATAGTAITLFNLGGVAGALAGGVVIASFGSRVSMLSMAAGGALGAAGLAAMSIEAGAAVGPILVMLTLTGAFINAAQTTMYALAAHVYPSATRATGVGTAVAVGRFGAALSGYVGSWAIEWGGSRAYFSAIAGAMVMSCLAIAAVARHIPARGARTEAP
jgi:AAHS family 4-hydroxybenzoate transporter-like MFS transporter